jgi:hypothetical protein
MLRAANSVVVWWCWYSLVPAWPGFIGGPWLVGQGGKIGARLIVQIEIVRVRLFCNMMAPPLRRRRTDG